MAQPQELQAATSSRVKEIARIEGASTRTLIGYGLVIGLDGTGDGKGTLFTVQSVGNLLQNMGLTVDSRAVKVKNVAAVMVTAEVSSYARVGSVIDVTVSSIGDASSLQGGTLLRTPLETSAGEMLGYAQGSVSIGGYNVQTGSGTSARKNHATVGRVPGGATIESPLATAVAISDSSVNLVLREPDVTTSFRMAEAISARFGNGTARAIDPQSVQLTVPESYRATGSVLGFLSELEGIEVAVDDIARVVLNERTGTIVVGGAVRILPVAISHGSLSIKVRSTPIISQPAFGPPGVLDRRRPGRGCNRFGGCGRSRVTRGGGECGRAGAGAQHNGSHAARHDRHPSGDADRGRAPSGDCHPMILSKTLAARTTTAGEGLTGEARRLWDAAEKLEALFVTQLVKASRMISTGGAGEHAGGSVYQGLAEESFGEALAQSSDFGISRELIQSLRATEAGGTLRPAHGPAASHRASEGQSSSAPPRNRESAQLDKLAARLAPFSEAVSDAAGQYGIDPSVITAVIVAESGGNARAVSPSGARGLMQIMPGTARELGLANPFDPRESILAGTRYLARMLDRFGGDLTLALAAYNAGPGAVRRHGGIPPYRETMRYVSKVLKLAGDLRLKADSG